jgi:transposase
MTTADGLPLAATLTAANHHELRQLLTLLLIEFPHVGGQRGRPLDRPRQVTTDKAYDCQTTRELLASIGIQAHIPRRGTADDQPLGATRWPIERTLSWLKQFRRLRIRWDRLATIHHAFLDIACALILWRQLAAT